MDRDWAKLGEAVRHARKSAELKQDELAAAVNVSRATIQAIERGDSFKKITHTHRAIAAHFGWDPGSIEATLAGGEPSPAEASADTAPPAFNGVASAPEDLPLRIKAALADGPLVDAAVIALPTEDGDEDPDAQMVVIVRGRRGRLMSSFEGRCCSGSGQKQPAAPRRRRKRRRSAPRILSKGLHM